MDADQLVEPAIERVAAWIEKAQEIETADDRAVTQPLHDLVDDPAGVSFAMEFIDRVLRPDNDRVAAHQLASLTTRSDLPSFLTPLDRTLLAAGARIARYLPRIVLPLARRRIRSIVGHLIVDARPGPRAAHLDARRAEGFDLNVNLLGELVLGATEADGRFTRTMDLLSQPDVDYVSVKLTSVEAQLEYWAWEESLDRVVERLIPLYDRAASFDPPKFINLDMEEYHDLELTVAAFKAILDRPGLHSLTAGIVLQAYLPDSYEALQELVGWATERKEHGGGEIRVRLVKGANLAMEQVEATMAGWEQAPYTSKADTDANYKRCVDWVLTPGRTAAVTLGIASHNLFDLAWADLVSRARGVPDRVSFEMLQGMVPAQARTVMADNEAIRLYTPVVAPDDFDSAIGYLFRRLEENAEVGNFMKVVFDMRPGSDSFNAEADKFRAAVSDRHDVDSGPRRHQPRPALGTHMGETFENEPDSDPALPHVRAWAREVIATEPQIPQTPITDSKADINTVIERARASSWPHLSGNDRAAILREVGNELARRRGEFLSAMVHEGKKTLAQADPEVSEAIDFATYYSQRCSELEDNRAATFTPLGVVVVVPPWNFPVAIPTGGALAALAAGNSVILKPAPETPRCAEIIAETCWTAGVPTNALQFVRTRDDEVGQHLVTSADAVILTGSGETADLFRSWKPDIALFAETSGKNALIITDHADVDLAVADLVASAFGHSGQKCSAASLAICVGEMYESDRFRRQLVDAVNSLHLGSPSDVETSMGPIIDLPTPKLEKALSSLDPGESWLVEPRQLAPDFWSPGVKMGVRPGSWFHVTECFGPVLGVMHAASLDEAIEMQNGTSFGLTGGIHTLDPTEIDTWLDRVEIGNAYVNRAITGAIVQRQPFGGWKRSAIGPAAKAGGPNYVAQLGVWTPIDSADSDYQMVWDAHFSREHDPTGLFCEANIFRYRPLSAIGVLALDSPKAARIKEAASVCGVAVVEPELGESDLDFVQRLVKQGVTRIRVAASLSPEARAVANAGGIYIADSPVTASGRIELQHYVREQAISRTLHRFGNVGRI